MADFNVLTRALTVPKVVSWLASSANLPTSVLPNAGIQLFKMQEADGQALAKQVYPHLKTQVLGM